MESRQSTTPFGRRPLTLAHMAANALAKGTPSDKAVHKWEIFRAICAAKALLGVSDRALAVLNALLSFHPETALTGDGLIVFPSNQQLCLRSHGMAETTVRRHLAALVDSGLILRRDSPNGKRYARKSGAGEIEKAFGFDLRPLVARGDEIMALAARVRAEEIALKLVRERITLCRRDIAKMFALGIEKGPTVEWQRHHALFRSIIARLPRKAAHAELEPIADELTLLADELENSLERLVNLSETSGNASQNERHIQNSNPKTPVESEQVFQGSLAEPERQTPKAPDRHRRTFPLGLVLQACPDVIDYARDGIASWRDLKATIEVVRGMLGISSSAWLEACDTFGDDDAASIVAAILQRGDAIKSAGGYLRDLTEKGQREVFSLGPMIMSLLRAQTKLPKRA